VENVWARAWSLTASPLRWSTSMKAAITCRRARIVSESVDAKNRTLLIAAMRACLEAAV
jgi:hypothetical protein